MMSAGGLAEGPAMDEEITALIKAWQAGDKEAEARCYAWAEKEVKRIIHAIRWKQSHLVTEQTTALFHDLYIRMANQRVDPKNRREFIGFMTRNIRQMLVDKLRERKAQKRGGGVVPEVFRSDFRRHNGERVEFATLNQLLGDYHQVDPNKALLVHLKFIGGYTFKEIANILEISEPTAKRHWKLAQLWLLDQLGDRGAGDDASSAS